MMEEPGDVKQVARTIWPTLLVSIVTAALVTGGLTYWLTQRQATSDKNNLQAQIDTLKDQLSASPTPSAVAIASPTPSPTASATPAATPTATPTATPASGCSLTASLSLSGGAAGSAYYDLVLANAANAGSCTLTGFPTVTALDANGTSLGTATNSGTSASVTLAAGKTAYSLLRFPASGNFSASACHAMDSLSIAVPGVSGTLKISNIASYDSAHTAKYCGDLGVGSFSATKQ